MMLCVEFDGFVVVCQSKKLFLWLNQLLKKLFCFQESKYYYHSQEEGGTSSMYHTYINIHRNTQFTSQKYFIEILHRNTLLHAIIIMRGDDIQYPRSYYFNPIIVVVFEPKKRTSQTSMASHEEVWMGGETQTLRKHVN